MKRVKTIMLVLVVLAVIPAGFWCYVRFGVREINIRITQEQIDAVLRSRFPKTRNYLKIVRITLENPQVMPIPGTDRVRIGLDARATVGVSGLEKHYDGGTTLTARIRYDADTYRFYLCDAGFERLDIPKIPEKHLATIRELATLASGEIVNGIPIYKLSEKQTHQNLARWLLKELRIENDAVMVRLGF